MKLHPARAGFDRFREAWDVVARSGGESLVLESRFVGVLVEHFASPSTRLALGEGDPPAAMALLERTRAGMWSTFQPSQAPVGLFVAADPAAASVFLGGLFRTLPGTPLRISVLQQDPELSRLPRDDAAPHAEITDYIETPRLRIDRPFEDYWSSRSKNLRHNIARQRRRLQDRGMRLELARIVDPDEAARAVETYGEIESRGWKAELGTAISPTNRQGRFYRDLLRSYCGCAGGVVYQLRLDGQVVASDLCLQRDGTIVILKTTFDEAVKGFSLGLLLHKEILRDLSDRGEVETVEFYGPARDWHRKLTDDVRTMYQVSVYRNPWVRRAIHVLRRLRPGSGS